MKLKIVQPSMAGRTATVWINGEVTKKVTDIDLHMNAGSYSTATITFVLDELEYDGEVEDASGPNVQYPSGPNVVNHGDHFVHG